MEYPYNLLLDVFRPPGGTKVKFPENVSEILEEAMAAELSELERNVLVDTYKNGIVDDKELSRIHGVTRQTIRDVNYRSRHKLWLWDSKGKGCLIFMNPEYRYGIKDHNDE